MRIDELPEEFLAESGMQVLQERLKHVEMILQSQDTQLRTVLNNLSINVACFNIDLCCHLVNQSFCDALGLPVEKWIGTGLKELLPEDWLHNLEPAMIRALTGETVKISFFVQGDHGQSFHKNAIVVSQRGMLSAEDRNRMGLLVLVSDDTERKQMHQKLVESLKEYEELKVALDAHAIVAITDAHGVITKVNDKFCAISQYSRDELIGNTHNIINSGFHPPEFFQELWRTISTGKVWNGEICNRAKNGSLYWVHTTIVPFLGLDGIPVQYIAIRADITQRKVLEQNVQRMALYDDLTGLPNRRLMLERLQVIRDACARSHHHGAIMFLDLDNFKEINDTYGHEEGDKLLRQVSQRLRDNVRQVDTIARAGGDEFILLLADLDEDITEATMQAYSIAEKLRIALSQPYIFNRFVLYTSTSIGITVFANGDEPKSELMKHADMALYRAKAYGKNRVSIFDPSLQAEVLARTSLLADLRQALKKHEFQLYYQPVVNREQEVIGHEALIRWLHPVRGVVAPGEFIALAEQTGLIHDIGQWVLLTACQQLKVWSADRVKSQWRLSVNVSARQFRDSNFVTKVQHVIKQSGADPSLLWLELTESMFHSNIEQTIDKMEALKNIGVHFSLDDFGTGYSSLSVLKLLPLDQLKIDRSFVQDVADDASDLAIVHTVLALANILHLSVVAEGIESPAQFDLLAQQGCHAFQGYYFGKPAPISGMDVSG